MHKSGRSSPVRYACRCNTSINLKGPNHEQNFRRWQSRFSRIGEALHFQRDYQVTWRRFDINRNSHQAGRCRRGLLDAILARSFCFAFEAFREVDSNAAMPALNAVAASSAAFVKSDRSCEARAIASRRTSPSISSCVMSRSLGIGGMSVRGRTLLDSTREG